MMPTISETNTELKQYLASLTPKELKAYHIAKSHLGMTYQYEKTIGYLEWKKKQTDCENT